jgi:hypothetical protein
MAAPRYVLPRYVLRRVPASGHDRPHAADGVVYHAVPAVLGQNRDRATAFAAAWRTWVSDGEPVYTNTPEGEGILATHRGEDPFAITTVLRVAWD